MAKRANKKKRPSKKATVAGIRVAGIPPRSGPSRPYIPQDQLTGPTPNNVLAADLLELTALLAKNRRALVGELTSALEIGQDEYENVDDVFQIRERAANGAATEIETRARQLDKAYPFSLDATGSTLTFNGSDNWGSTLYILSLILSHLPSEHSPILERAGLVPAEADIVKLRRWFQCCAAASVAAEIGGDAWTFGWPRPDGSAFLDKLKRIWLRLQDGDVRENQLPGTPSKAKDDEIDIIAARQSVDGLHGFPIILGQVASGHNWRSKPLRGHADHVFYPEWFSTIPASQTLVYHIIPFVIDPDMLRRETRRLGHLMHRVRLCSRALEAHGAIQRGASINIEGTQAFKEVDDWTAVFRSNNFTN
jgi:hypothetical protein